MSSPQIVRVDPSLARKRAAEHLERAHREIPVFYVSREVRVDRLVDYCKRGDISPMARVLATVGPWLGRFHRLNGHWTSGFEAADQVDIGVAVNHQVDEEEALIVVSLADCSNWGSRRFHTELETIREKSRLNRFLSSDFVPATFTISSLGRFGVSAFTSIINRPQVAILSVASFQPIVVIQDGSIQPATVLPLTIAADHRAMAGAYVARALADLSSHLEANDADD